MAQLDPEACFLLRKSKLARILSRCSLRTAFVLYAGGGLLAGLALALLTTSLLGLAAEKTLPEKPYLHEGIYIYDDDRSLLVPAESLSWYAEGQTDASASPSDPERSIVLYVESPENQYQASIDTQNPPEFVENQPIYDAKSAERESDSPDTLPLSEIPSYDSKMRNEREGAEAAANLASILPENSDGEKPLVSNVGYYIAYPGDPALYRMVADIALAAIPIDFLVCLVIAGRLFYRNRIKSPLEEMDQAAKMIASGNLAFEMKEQREDELGRLCLELSSMRSELEAAERKLWRAAENRRKVNAAFAHDLRTPLTVIEGQAEIISMMAGLDKLDPEKTKNASEAILRQAKRLEGYADSMNGLDSLDSRPARIVAVNLSEWFSETSTDIRSLAESKGLSFTASGPSLPSSALTDSTAISQIAENLAANAARHARSRISFTCEWNEGTLSIIVEDDGAGFSDKALDKACEPFWREETDGEQGREEPHFGLGLCICATLCEQLKGWIDLGSSHLGGARVKASVDAPTTPDFETPE